MQTLFQFTAVGLNNLDSVAAQLNTSIPGNSIILLEGDLSAGKTTLVAALIRCLDAGIEVSSPTFALHNEYRTPSGIVDHFDLYRVESSDELETTGFWEIVNSQNYQTIIEWPSKIRLDELPKFKSIYGIKISKVQDDRRDIIVQKLN